MTQATCELKAAGKPYPRTCPVCKLGPCPKMKTIPVNDLSLIDRMSDYRAREIARAIDEDDPVLASEWSNMKVPEFLARCRAAFKENDL